MHKKQYGTRVNRRTKRHEKDEKQGLERERRLMEQVQATPDGAKRRSTRPQHAFHDEDSLGATPSNSSGSDALSVRQGALSSGERAMWQQPRILLAIGAVACFLLLIFAVSR